MFLSFLLIFFSSKVLLMYYDVGIISGLVGKLIISLELLFFYFFFHRAVRFSRVLSSHGVIVSNIFTVLASPQFYWLLFGVQGSFDGNSMKVAELLFKNGFKAAYAIKGGVRGKKGWMVCFHSLLLIYHFYQVTV